MNATISPNNVGGAVITDERGDRVADVSRETSGDFAYWRTRLNDGTEHRYPTRTEALGNAVNFAVPR